MVTKLDRPVRRELRIGEKPYVITISHDRLRVAVKGRRKGRELFWEELVGDEDAGAVSARQTVPCTAGTCS
jgi:hypothetical protein